MSDSLALESLGWKGFHDLCLVVVSEVLGQTVEGFLDSRDGGRDGAFYGRWRPSNEEDVLEGAFVIQCKHISRAGARLTRSAVADELEKARALVERGLCDVYLLMTNAGVSGRLEANLQEAFRAVGVGSFRVLGATWLEQRIREHKRLRALVPRLYGLGDLSQILDERAYVGPLPPPPLISGARC
jgi:hypothetical protein